MPHGAQGENNMAVQVLDEAAEAAEFAALVAELEAPQGDEDDADGAAPEGDSSADPDEDDDTDSELEDEDEPAEDDEEDEDLDDDDDGESLDANEVAAKKLFEAGDIKGACKRLGLDPKIFKVKPREFTAMRKGLADAKKLAEEGRTKAAKGEKLRADAEQVYGPIVAGFQAYKGGDPMKLRAAIELMCEDSFENVVATVARAAKGLDPAQVEVIKLRKELADREAAQKAEQTKAQTEAQAKTEVAKLSRAIKNTPLAKIDGAAQEIYDLVAASFDGTGYGLTAKQAYAQVKAKHAKVAKAFGAKLDDKPGKKGSKTSKRTELAPVRTPAKPLTKADKEAAERAEFEQVLKEAKEATKAQERRSRRAR
jgi:hypothetical protein